MKQMAELAKRRNFNGIGPGVGTLKVNDTSLREHTEVDCGERTLRIDESWRGGADKQLAQFMAPYTFSVMANLEAKTAIVTFGAAADGEHRYTIDGKTRMDPTQVSVMDRITIDPSALDKDGGLVLPLKETPLPAQNAANYYGAATIKFKFGPNNQFTGSMIVSYSVTRKLPPKEDE